MATGKRMAMDFARLIGSAPAKWFLGLSLIGPILGTGLAAQSADHKTKHSESTPDESPQQFSPHQAIQGPAASQARLLGAGRRLCDPGFEHPLPHRLRHRGPALCDADGILARGRPAL